jgi:hypothetical protein
LDRSNTRILVRTPVGAFDDAMPTTIASFSILKGASLRVLTTINVGVHSVAVRHRSRVAGGGWRESLTRQLLKAWQHSMLAGTRSEVATGRPALALTAREAVRT